MIQHGIPAAGLVLVLWLLAPAASQEAPRSCISDIVFLVDSSGSVLDNSPITEPFKNWNLVKEFMRSVVRRFEVSPVRTQFAAVRFGDSATLQFYLNSNINRFSVIRSINAISYKPGKTNAYAGLRLITDEVFLPGNGDRSYAPDIVIFISDGVSTVNAKLAYKQAEVLRSRGVTVLGVGVSNLVSEPELRNITDGRYWTAANFTFLPMVLDPVVDSICQLTASVTTPEPRLPKECFADIAFIIDSSGSIRDANDETTDNWMRLLEFIENMVLSFQVGETKTLFAAVKFANRGNKQFYLNEYMSQDEVASAVRNISFSGGDTNLAAGIEVTRTEIFHPDNGDRSQAPNIGIILTDGVPTVNISETQLEADAAKQARILLLGVGITNFIDEALLYTLTGGNFWTTPDFRSLNNLVEAILQAACKQPSGITTPTTTRRVSTVPGPVSTTPISSTTTSTTTTTPSTPVSTSTVLSTTASTTPVTTTTPVSTPTVRSTITSTTPSTRSTPVSTPATPSTPESTPTVLSTTSSSRATMPSTPASSTVTTSSLSTSITSRPTPTNIPEPQPCRDRAEVVFLLDSSGSVSEFNFYQVRDFVKGLVMQLDIDTGRTRAAALSFSDDAILQFHLDQFTNRADVASAVDKIAYSGGKTNAARAIKFAKDTILPRSRAGVRRFIVLLSDGESNDNIGALNEAVSAKTDNIHFITLGVGEWTDDLQLQTMSSYPASRNYIHLNSYSELTGSIRTMLAIICNERDECITEGCEGNECVDDPNVHWCTCPPGRAGLNCGQLCRETADVVFIVDSSGSYARGEFYKVTQYVASAIMRLNIAQGTRVAVIVFSDTAEVVFYLDAFTSKKAILDALNIQYMGGTTNTELALKLAREQVLVPARGDRANVRNIIVLVTDGRSADLEATWAEAVTLRDSGVTILGVGVCFEMWDCQELEYLASSPVSGNVLLVDTIDQLPETLDNLVSAMCNEDNECTLGHCKNGAACQDGVNTYRCTCSQGFSGPNCTRECFGELDLAFIMDASGSIRGERFPQLQSFVRSIISDLEVSPDLTRVSAISFSNDSALGFHLDMYSQKQDILSGITRMSYQGGRTNIASALRLLRTEIFSTSNGDRPTVQNIAVIVTDGQSNVDTIATIPEAVRVRLAGIHMMAVSVGDLPNDYEIRAIVSEPEHYNIFKAPRSSQLPSLVDSLSSAICDDVDECSSNPCFNGGTCVNSLGRYICLCSAGRAGYDCQFTCSRMLDIVFVLDLSGSRDLKFEMTINFTRRVIYGLDYNFGRTRIGVVSYSNNAQVQFYLDDYQTREDLLQAITYYYRTGTRRTNTQEGINLMRTRVFSTARGDRVGADNIAVVLTDGNSNIEEQNTVPEANQAKNAGVRLYAVAMLDGINMAELNGIASSPEMDYVIRVSSPNDVDNRADDLAKRLCL